MADSSYYPSDSGLGVKKSSSTSSGGSDSSMTPSLPLHVSNRIDPKKCRWLFPFIGHMGIATSSGVIRDFAGPYYVSEDDMAFGTPTKYWQLSLDKVKNREIWDNGVKEASEEYKTRMHNLFCDNCHSHVAYALNTMNYNGSTTWNMVKLAFYMLIYSKYVSCMGFIKTWLPFLILLAVIVGIVCGTKLS